MMCVFMNVAYLLIKTDYSSEKVVNCVNCILRVVVLVNLNMRVNQHKVRYVITLNFRLL